MKTWKDIGDNISCIELCGDMYGRVNLIIDNDKNKMYMEYGGEITGELLANLRMAWNRNVTQRTKKIIRDNVKIVKNLIFRNYEKSE